MGKRLRVSKSIRSCSSPRYSSAPPFAWHEEDIWTEIAKSLDAKSLVMLAATSKWFYKTMMHDCIWKFACLRDLQVPDCTATTFKWAKLYASALGTSHSYAFRDQEKHIDWMRIGAFCFTSPDACLMENLILPAKLPNEETIQQMLNAHGFCYLRNLKTGVWLADIQLVRCPVCDMNTCDGTMQVLDARHIELFLCDGYLKGKWQYKQEGSHDVKKPVDYASAGLFDFKYLKSPETAGVFNLKSWVGKPNDWQPKAMVSYHAVAIRTNLQENEGLNVKYHVMRSGDTGKVMAIRMSQQLL